MAVSAVLALLPYVWEPIFGMGAKVTTVALLILPMPPMVGMTVLSQYVWRRNITTRSTHTRTK